MENRIYNFSAGPGVLPEEVLLEAQKDLFSYKGKGLSVMEMSHRSKDYEEIIFGAMAAAKRIMDLGEDYDILFLQGGASLQFLMVPMNLCPNDKIANYINTGTWSTGAYKEAPKAGKKAHLAATSEDKDFTYIPKTFNLSENPAYLHITTNNTIRGTEYSYIPQIPEGVLLVADMSSNFLSRKMDFKKFDLIYAGAQKNIGPAGVTMVAVKKGTKFQEKLPTMLDYKTHIDNESMKNTPPCFAIYMVGLVLKWIERNGGLEAIEANNIKKAAYIYDILDSSPFYRGTVVKEDRSRMNVPFRLLSEELEEKFIAAAKAKNMIGLKGHRSVGGIRASLYNALPLTAVQALADFMLEFEKNNK